MFSRQRVKMRGIAVVLLIALYVCSHVVATQIVRTPHEPRR